jgi:hypothetical protein
MSHLLLIALSSPAVMCPTCCHVFTALDLKPAAADRASIKSAIDMLHLAEEEEEEEL